MYDNMPVSIPYGKGKAIVMQKSCCSKEFQFPMGKVKELSFR